MGFVLVVLLVVVIYFLFVRKPDKTSGGSGAGKAEERPADALVRSPYYAANKTAFDFIRYDGRQPKYKIDWLLESLSLGHQVEGYYVIESIKKDLPYFCETEDEYDCFTKDSSLQEGKLALRGDIDAIMNMAVYYRLNSHAHPSKCAYWRDKVLQRAESGDIEAQGALCFGLARQVFGQEEAKRFSDQYRDSIRQKAEDGDPHAQLAMGAYIAEYESEESRSWLRKAGEQGLSNAWYKLGHMYAFMRTEDRPEEDREDWPRKIAECYLAGAKADNGTLAAQCQYLAGSYYQEGDILPRDLEKAKYWYKKAADHGHAVAAGSLQFLIDHPDGYV